MKRIFFAFFILSLAASALGQIPLRQSTATSVTLGPFLDSTNGNDLEAGLTINQSDVQRSINGGAFFQKNHGGAAVYDRSGHYQTGLSAIDTSVTGCLTLYVHVTGALYIKRDYDVQTATAYDALHSTGNFQVDAVKIGGTTQTGRDIGASVLLSNGTGAGQISLSSGAVTVGTNNDKDSYTLSDTGRNALWTIPATRTITGGTIGTYTGNTPQTGDAYAIVNNGTYGNSALGTAIAAIPTPIPTPTVPSAADIKTAMEAEGSHLALIKTKTDYLPSATAGATGGVAIVGSVMGKSPATLAAADVTGNLPADVNQWKGATAPAMTGDAYAAVGALTIPTVADIWAGIVDGAVDAKTALKRLLAAVYNTATVTGDTTTKTIVIKASDNATTVGTQVITSGGRATTSQ